MTIGDFDPLKGERMAPAWRAMAALMEDGEWHYRDELVEVGLKHSDLLRESVRNLLARMSAPDGPVQRKGSIKNRRYRMVVE
jgi:hypothetical protein